MLAAIAAAAIGFFAATVFPVGVANASYDPDYYVFCINSIGQEPAYCCPKAGGTFSNGACNAEVIQAPPPNDRYYPPIIVVPSGLA